MMDSEDGIARPAEVFELEHVDNTYGNFVSPDGNFFGGSSGGWVVWLDIRSGEVREIPVEVPGSRGREGSFGPDGSVWGGMRKLTRYNPATNAVTQYDPPTPYFHAYSTKVDKNGEVWSGEQSNGRVYRFDPGDEPLDRVRAALDLEPRLQLLDRQLDRPPDLLVRRPARLPRAHPAAGVGGTGSPGGTGGEPGEGTER